MSVIGTAAAAGNTAHRIDTSRFPLVVIELAVHPTASDNRALVDAITGLTSRGERFGIVIDLRKLNPVSVSAVSRKEVAAAYAANLEARLKAIICEARVIETPLLRGLAVAFDWLVGRHWPSITFSSFAPAEEWVLAHIHADDKK